MKRETMIIKYYVKARKIVRETNDRKWRAEVERKNSERIK